MAREGAEMRRSAVKMADGEMRMAATTAMKTTAMKATAVKTAAMMSATAVAAAVTTTAMTAAAASRDGVSGRRQCGRENNDGNSQSEL